MSFLQFMSGAYDYIMKFLQVFGEWAAQVHFMEWFSKFLSTILGVASGGGAA